MLTPPNSGWFEFVLIGTPRGALTHVSFTNVFDGLPDFVQWMRRIARSEMPATCEVEEEGTVALLHARAIVNRPDWMELEIVRRSSDQPAAFPIKQLYLSRVARRQFTREFARRFDSWLAKDYVAEEWHLHGSDGEQSCYAVGPVVPINADR